MLIKKKFPPKIVNFNNSKYLKKNGISRKTSFFYIFGLGTI